MVLAETQAGKRSARLANPFAPGSLAPISEELDHIPFVRLYQKPKRRIYFLTPNEAMRLLAELPPHLREMTQFSPITGLRQRNVSYLQWDQMDMARQMAWIHADVTKAGSAIGVPLNEMAMDVLRRAGIRPDFRSHDLRYTWATWSVQNGTRLQDLRD